MPYNLWIMGHKMTLSAPFSLIHSEFNDFLFAPIGEEENGMLLSVLSALTRRGVDPWDEAARLAKLPNGSAADALTPMIAGIAGRRWPLADAPKIAARLVELLPKHGSASPSKSAGARSAVESGSESARSSSAGAYGAGGSFRHRKLSTRALVWLICLVLGAAVIVVTATDRTLPLSDDHAPVAVSPSDAP